MRCTVIWYASAQDDLARIWLAAIERTAVTDAANQIDQILRDNAESIGTDFQGWKLLHVPRSPWCFGWTLPIVKFMSGRCGEIRRRTKACAARHANVRTQSTSG